MEYNSLWNLTPHLRYYHQSAADFYRHSLVTGTAIPNIVSADSRLAKFDATTIGAKLSYLINPKNEVNVSIENICKMVRSTQMMLWVFQKGLDMFPDLTAMIYQIGYTFRW